MSQFAPIFHANSLPAYLTHLSISVATLASEPLQWIVGCCSLDTKGLLNILEKLSLIEKHALKLSPEKAFVKHLAFFFLGKFDWLFIKTLYRPLSFTLNIINRYTIEFWCDKLWKMCFKWDQRNRCNTRLTMEYISNAMKHCFRWVNWVCIKLTLICEIWVKITTKLCSSCWACLELSTTANCSPHNVNQSNIYHLIKAS